MLFLRARAVRFYSGGAAAALDYADPVRVMTEDRV